MEQEYLCFSTLGRMPSAKDEFLSWLVIQTRNVLLIPDSYTTVQPVILPKKEPPVPPRQGPLMGSCTEMPSACATEHKWLDNVRDRLNQEISKETFDMSWAAFHASLFTDRSLQLDVSLLFPLFQGEVHSAAMICHAISVVSQAVCFLNPGQVPILACIAKKIQWNWPSTYGEKKLVVMFGDLHTELAALRAMGHDLKAVAGLML